MDEKALEKSMGCLKTANKFRTEIVLDESAKGDNPDSIEEKQDKMNSDNSESESDNEEKRLKNIAEAKKLFKARKDLKLPLNDYERKRALNIRDMAEVKKKFKDDLKASKNALKQVLKKKSQAPRPMIKCEFCERHYKIPLTLEKHQRLVHKHKLKNMKSEVYFECMKERCAESFKTYDMIKEHIAQSHNFTCSACKESFKSKIKENRHNCLPFKCDCRKKFKTEQDLKAHDCHKCKYCDELFPNAVLMNKHKKRHFNHKNGRYELDLVR